MFPEGTVPPGIALALECTMHSCKKQFLRASSIEQFRTTKPLKAATLSIWQLLTWHKQSPHNQECCLHRHSPGEQRLGSRVIGFATLSIPPPGRGFPASPLSAKTVSIFHTVSLKSYQISGCRRQIIWAALWQMHCWGCPVTHREKGKFLPLLLFCPCQAHLPSTAASISVTPGNDNSTKGSAHALIRGKHGLMERFSFFIFPEKGYPRKTIYDYSPVY